MTETLYELCKLSGTSGREESIRNYIIDKIKDKADIKIDALGNIIAYKKGKSKAEKTVMVDAHMDEVGLIVTYICSDGTLKFDTVGGINIPVIIGKRVTVNGLTGVVGIKPIHLSGKDELKKTPEKSSLYIDIGAKTKAEAEEKVALGDVAYFEDDGFSLGQLFCSKAIDDRMGCAELIEIVNTYDEYDFYATFTCLEEVGGAAGCVAAAIAPDVALVLEATTASDVAGVPDGKKVCEVGKGVAVSFMDRATVYDKALFDTALKTAKEKGIACQVKSAVAGGNNAGSIHKSGKGVRTLALSVPTRYIHSPLSVADTDDMLSAVMLAKEMITAAASGKV